MADRVEAPPPGTSVHPLPATGRSPFVRAPGTARPNRPRSCQRSDRDAPGVHGRGDRRERDPGAAANDDRPGPRRAGQGLTATEEGGKPDAPGGQEEPGCPRVAARSARRFRHEQPHGGAYGRHAAAACDERPFATVERTASPAEPLREEGRSTRLPAASRAGGGTDGTRRLIAGAAMAAGSVAPAEDGHPRYWAGRRAARILRPPRRTPPPDDRQNRGREPGGVHGGGRRRASGTS
jgi:hypothetical protein